MLKIRFYNKYFATFLVFLLFVMISVFFWEYFKSQRLVALQKEFNAYSEMIHSELQHEIDNEINYLYSLKAYYDASENVTAEEFVIFCKQLLKNNPNIFSLQWIDILKDEDRLHFINQIQKEGYKDFYIKEKAETSEYKASQNKAVYYPITHIYPFKKFQAIQGFDLGSYDIYLKNLEFARDTGLVVTTKNLLFDNDGLNSETFFSIIPLYKNLDKPTLFHRRKKLRGFVVGVFKVENIVKETMYNVQMSRDINTRLVIYDLNSERQNHNKKCDMLFSQNQNRENTYLISLDPYEGYLNLPGKNWKIKILPQGVYSFYKYNVLSLPVLIIGLLFSLILAFLFYLYLLYREKSLKVGQVNSKLNQLNLDLESKVKKRTQEIASVNFDLQDTIEKMEKQQKAVLSLMQDIKAAKDKEEMAGKELQRLNLELKESNRELEQFAFIASHDLQEPLRKINSFVYLLEEKLKNQVDEETQTYFQYVRNAARRLKNLIQDILEFSRAGNTELKLETVDLNNVVKNVLISLDVIVKEKQAQIIFDNLPQVKCSETLIAQVFQNLINNAIKFHKVDVKPSVKISSKQKDGFYEFTVSDNGIGIESQYFDKIFGIFQRLHSKSQYEGTGIGLSLCKKIVERHGGVMTVESKMNKGSRFIFTLPNKI